MKHYLIICLFFCGFLTTAQTPVDTPPVSDNAIQVVGRVFKDRILLRWGTTRPLAWKQLNRYGYTIERYTILRDGKTLPEPEKNILTSNPLLPEPVENWVNDIETNNNAAIIAQAIFGESFDVSGKSSIESVVALSEEIEQRHTFALYTADQDFEIAKKAALGYDDRTVKSNEKYVYRIISNVPFELNDIAYGGVFIGYQDRQELPKPLDLAVTFNDGTALLSWNYAAHSSTFTSYHIERSLEGDSFKRVNNSPYTLLNQAADQRSGRIFYVDSITNNLPYTYRVQGISIFGENSPYSDVVKGKGASVLEYVPHITIKKMIDDTSVDLTWEFPEEGNSQIKGFNLNRSNGSGETEEVLLQNIPPTSRTVRYGNLKPSNYFTISAIGKNNAERTSFPILVQPIDSIPPKQPKGLIGKIDSTGVVRLRWEPNTDADIFGYRVFRGNIEKEEFSQLTSNPIATNGYVDSVAIKNLNDKVYYKIVALDYRYNQSIFSEILTIKKPDVIPPTSPVFKKFEVKEGDIILDWAKSSSQDAITTQLYRKESNLPDWLLVYEGENNVERFTDKKGEEGVLYSYTLLAIDDSDLESPPSPSISVTIPKSNKSNDIKGFYGVANKIEKSIQLTWRYRSDDVAEFEIYKAKKEEKLRLLRVVPPDTRLLSDTDLKINTSYIYGIRAVFKDGRISKVKKITLKY